MINEQYELVDAQPEVNNAIEESLPASLGRNAARTVARAGESIVGLPADIASSIFNVASELTGGLIPPNTYEKFQQESIFPWPKTSHQYRETVTKPLTGEYLEPKSGTEEGWDQIVDTAAPLLLGNAPGTV